MGDGVGATKKKHKKNTKKLKREVIFAITAMAFESGVS